MLTIMSFCFLGELTLVASAFDGVKSNHFAAILVVASLGLWVTAFSAAMFGKIDKTAYYVIPGYSEGFSFLPTSAEGKEFKKSKTSPFDADDFFMRKALRRIGLCGLEDVSYDELSKMVGKKIGQLSFGESFNKNAWFALLVYMTRGEMKNLQYAKWFYRILYAVFIVSIVCLFAAVGMCLFT